MKEALYYKILDSDKKLLICYLCPHNCKLSLDKIGICRVRKNIDGKLYSLSYNGFSSTNIDPIEKKPLYHFYPGYKIFSVGTIGCNMRCLHCQNWQISQVNFGKISLTEITPEQAVELAITDGSIGISYTYNEPLINYEWIFETSKLLSQKNLKNVLVTNGYINEQPLLELLPYIDAANIDIKAFSPKFYKKTCAGNLEYVLKTVELFNKHKKHLEVTYLIIPTKNDSEEEIKNFVKWLSSINQHIPLHFSRYYPQYKTNLPQTSMSTLENARKIASKKLKYVYLGNVWEIEYNRTYCPECKSILIEREGYTIMIKNLSKDGSCQKCLTKIYGVF